LVDELQPAMAAATIQKHFTHNTNDNSPTK